MKSTKRILSLLLALAMVFSLLPASMAAFAAGEKTSYEAIGELANLTDGEYIISVWRYIGQDNAQGFALHSENNNSMPVTKNEDYSMLTNEAIGDAAIWEIKTAEGGYTIMNKSTGKYLGDAIPAASDEPVVHPIVEGECNGVHDYAVGNSAGTGSLRFSGSSGTFSFNTTAPETEVSRAWAANVLIHRVVVEEPSNVAPKATAASATCASWNSVAGVIDGAIPAQSQGNQAGAYGSWGQNSSCDPEIITLRWNTEVELTGAGLFFWHDNGKDNRTGIDFPVSYTFEYLTGDEETWAEVPNASGMGLEEDVMNATSFDTVRTKALRVSMVKESADDNSYGLGVAEFEAYGWLTALDTTALEAAIARAEAITNLENYTEQTVSAMNTALSTAKTVLENPGSQAAIDDAADALEAAVAALVIKPVDKPDGDNIAPQGTATATYCASWNNVAGVNDGAIPEQSYGNQAGAYGSWGRNNNAADEPITITFETAAEIKGAGMYFWNDGDDPFNQSGINFPASYTFEYLDGEEWKPVANARGMNNAADEMNYSTFDTVSTTALRVVMKKAATGSFGIGVAEFEIYGTLAGTALNTAALEAAIAAAVTVDTALYTEQSVAAMSAALAEAEAVLAKEDKTQAEIDAAAEALNAAIAALETKPGEPPAGAAYEAIGALENLTDGEYIISVWRYIGQDNAEGFALHSENNNSMPVTKNEDYSMLTNEAIGDAAIWEIKTAEGGYTIMNKSTGKYLGDAIPAASDEPVVHPIVEGECNGVHDYAVGNSAGTGSLRFSGSSGTFSFNTTAPETEVSRAWAANVLIHKVVTSEAPSEPVTAALEAAIAAAGAVETALYTEQSVAAMNAALAEAEAVLAKEDKTQAEIDAVAEALNAAIAALETKSEEPESTTYELVADPAEFSTDEEYVIVLWRYFSGTNDDSKNGYVFNGTDNKCGGVRAAAAEDYSTISTESAYADDALWKIAAVEGGYTVQNVATGKYLGNAIPAASDEAVTLLIGTGAVNGVTNYAIGYDESHYLRYSGSSDSFSFSSGTLSSAASSTNACNVLFYKAPKNDTPMEPVQMFTGSDIQGSSDWNQHLDNIAKNAYDAGNDITVSFWCGDYADGSVYEDGSDTSSTETPQRIQYIKDTLGKYWPELSDYHFAQGNHDGSEHIGNVIDVTGPKEYDAFVLYQINEDDFPWWQAGYSTYSAEDTCLEKINATTAILGAYLDGLIEKNDTRVVFIYTHVPLHWTSRTTTYNSWWSDNIHANILFDMINEKAKDLDIVFLYGHNHSETYAEAYPAGGTVNFFAPGDEIRIPNGVVAASGNYTTEIINFTYLNAGYVGQTAAGFNPSVATASVITVKEDRVEFTRYSDEGHYDGSDRVLLRNSREELPVYLTLSSEENPKVRKEGDVEHFKAILKNAEAAEYVWSVAGSGEIAEGQGTDTAAIRYTGGGTVTVTVSVSYTDSSEQTQTLTEQKTVEVKESPKPGLTTYTEVKSVSELAAGKKYAIVAWRYFGGSNDDTYNGYGFGADDQIAYRAPTEDNYETIAPEAELADTSLWYIVPVDGGYTVQNIGTGKYLGSTIPAASDDPVTLTIAEGECNGVYNLAIGTAAGSVRYSNSSTTFVYSTTAPESEVTRSWAANLTVYEVVTPKVYTNIAPAGTASSDFCASWSSVAGVNDEVIPDSSNPGYDYNEAYGSWGKNSNSNPETILITFSEPAEIFAAGAYFWYNADGPHNQTGIDIPASYTWEYLNDAGEWVAVPNAVGLGIEEDVMNVTDFDTISTTAIRINMTKSATGSYGLGVAELEVYGKFVELDTTALAAAIAQGDALKEEDYTPESWAPFIEALADAKTVQASATSQSAIDSAAGSLLAAIEALVELTPDYVDKAALRSAIEAANALNEVDWTAESWAALATALAAGKTVEADGNATQESVDNAAAAIEAAVAALVDKVQAVIDLIDAIEEPYGLEDEEAITAAREAFDALTEAEQDRVTNYTDLLIAEIAYYEALAEKYKEEEAEHLEQAAAAFAEAKQAAIDALTIFYESAAVDCAEPQVTAGKAALDEAIAAVEATEDSTALRAAVDAGLAAIDEALRANASDVDKSELDAAIAAAKAVKKDKYTDETVAALEAALGAAEAVQGDPDADQAAVDAAAEALNNAIKALEKKPVEGGMADIDFTDPADKVKYEISGQTESDVEEGVGLALTASQGGIEPAKQSIAEQDIDVVRVPVSGDWTATLEVEFDANGAANGYYQFFGFFASEGGDNQNMVGIRGGDGAMQDFIRSDGAISEELNTSAPGFDTTGKTYYLRIEKEDDAYTCYRSDDGEEFTEMFSFDATGIEADEILIDAYTGMTAGYKFTLKSLTFEGGETKPVDKSKLEAAIEAAEAIDTDPYTEESVAALAAAIEAAKAVQADPDATQKAVNDAAKAVNDAVKALEQKPAPVDKTALDAAITAAEAVDTEPYTDESVAALAAAVEAAKAVLAKEDATQAEVDASAKAVDDAVKALEKKPEPPKVDKTELDKAVNAAGMYDENDYTPESYAPLAEAVEAAKAVQAKEDATQDEVDAAAAAVNEAIAGLEKKPEALDKAALIAAIADAEALDPAEYTDESAQALADGIAAAKDALANAADQDAIDAAVAALKDVVDNLEKKPIVPPVDTTTLEEAIAAAEALKPEDYTEDSAKALADGIAAAKEALEKAADQAAVDAAVVALDEVVKGLEKKPAEEPFRFDDVKDPAKFYFDPVYWAYEHEPQITNGMDATHFGPDNPCTRGHVVTFLWRAAGCPEPKSTQTVFTDLKKGAFYEKAVAWAVEEGITNGTSNTTFSPDATCTRGQIVTFLWRFKGKDDPKSTGTPFTDLKSGAFYEKAVAWAVENNVTKGMTETTFVPDGTCTRGQVVTFLYRAMNNQ